MYDRVVTTMLGLREVGCLTAKDTKISPLDGELAADAVFSDYGSGPFSSLASLLRYFNLEHGLACRFGKCQEPQFTIEDFSPVGFVHGDLAAKNLILGSNSDLWLID
jgi:hypothetical protein